MCWLVVANSMKFRTTGGEVRTPDTRPTWSARDHGGLGPLVQARRHQGRHSSDNTSQSSHRTSWRLYCTLLLHQSGAPHTLSLQEKQRAVHLFLFGPAARDASRVIADASRNVNKTICSSRLRSLFVSFEDSDYGNSSGDDVTTVRSICSGEFIEGLQSQTHNPRFFYGHQSPPHHCR